MILLLLLLFFALLVALGVAILQRPAPAPAPAPSGEVPYRRAITALIQGDAEGALRYLRETVRQDTGNVEAYVWLADLLRQRGEPERALAIHRELSVRHIADPAIRERVYEGLTRDYIALGRHAHAILAAEQLRAINRQSRVALELLVSVYEALRDWERAYETMEELVRLDGRGPAFLALYKSYIGRDYLAHGQDREALRWFKEALRLDGRCLQALLSLGDVYYADGKLDQAISLWRAVTMRYPKMAWLVFDRLEKVYFEKGIFSEVFRIYEDLLREDARDVRTLLAVATMHAKKGDSGRAIRLVREALEYNPADVPARQHLVRLLCERGDAATAMSEIARLVEPVDADQGALTCRACGHRSQDVLWRCPACAAWESYTT